MDKTLVAPLTPQKVRQIPTNLKIGFIIENTLNYDWDLGLPVPKDGDSPQKRNKERTTQQEIVFKITVLSFRNVIDPLIKIFEHEASVLYSGWVHKPRGERGVVPEKSRHSKISITEKERAELHVCLLRILNPEYVSVVTPKGKHHAGRDPNSTNDRTLPPDDTAIPFELSNARCDKRLRDQTTDGGEVFKKPRIPQPQIQLSESFPPVLNSRTASFASNAPSLASSIFSNAHRSFPENFTQETVSTQEIMDEPNEESSAMSRYREVVNTSFDGTTAPSSSYGAGSLFDADLDFLPDGPNLVGIGQSDPVIDEELSQDLLEQAAINTHKSRGEVDAAGSESEADLIIDPEMSELGEQELKERLHGVFPDMPSSFHKLPLSVAYEITRVFLYAGVPLIDLRIPPSTDLSNYATFWTFISKLQILNGKSIPERSSRQAWVSALVDSGQSQVVHMTGSLLYNFSAEPGPLFRLRLNALRLDSSHRAGRQFGHERFLELDIPELSGRRVPKVLKLTGTIGSATIIEWLVDGRHCFLGKDWKPYHLKPRERKESKTESKGKTQEPEPIHRMYFFAVDGLNFKDMPVSVAVPQRDAKISIDLLLNRLRPTRKNLKQPFLKLFSRTDLAVSRNNPTFILERHQIRNMPDIQYNEELMTDGAGRISPSLASKVALRLGLSHVPSGFQARIGEGKGFWSVKVDDNTGEDWLEVYDSQRKWERSTKVNGESDHHSHRTFEVLRYSCPLKSADLNLQILPLLVARAEPPEAMTRAISNLLVEGLGRQIENLQLAMDSPQVFRKWVREMNPNITERLRAGAVPYRAGLPAVLEERVGALLEAGFDPKELFYLKEMTRKLFRSYCEDLKKRMNITVGKSAYVYMIPDFAGVLEPDEVFLDFSGFVDDTTKLSCPTLRDIDVLVARSPAHYKSDIQKVRAVVRAEFVGLKDVIIFPTKGNPSLAAKLSGGDYDGDIALVIWEPSIVNPFVNAAVPKVPNLVEEKFIRQNKMHYEELVRGHSKPTSTFLKECFAFNMKPSYLGICTNFKENLCYTQKSQDTYEATFLSTLLSSLVDSAKQGYIFEEEDWGRITKEVIKLTPMVPLYKTGQIEKNAEHIIDHLVYVANTTVETRLEQFHIAYKDPPHWDEDLVSFYNSAREVAKQDATWLVMLDNLNEELKAFKASWQATFSRSPLDESKPDFGKIGEFYTSFQSIVPNSPASCPWLFLDPDPELTQWALLRASALFASCSKNYVPNVVWWMAGRQLFHLKARARLGAVAMTPSIHVTLKPDASFIRRLQTNESASCEAPASIEEVEELGARYD